MTKLHARIRIFVFKIDYNICVIVLSYAFYSVDFFLFCCEMY